MNKENKKSDEPAPQSATGNTNDRKLTPLRRGSLPAVPDSDPLFQRGFIIGGRGFRGSSSRKDSE